VRLFHNGLLLPTKVLSRVNIERYISFIHEDWFLQKNLSEAVQLTARKACLLMEPLFFKWDVKPRSINHFFSGILYLNNYTD